MIDLIVKKLLKKLTFLRLGGGIIKYVWIEWSRK